MSLTLLRNECGEKRTEEFTIVAKQHLRKIMGISELVVTKYEISCEASSNEIYFSLYSKKCKGK